ncbi:MAG: GPW/gp25 family protein [Cyanobacteria bacterium SID2]|nr:GPW/gp25 family protein [Cyanobacteria bacterium SID2]MBP0003245.1 GPW/gp25 family protein [Cyanobacteria bacterium SBC]
MSRKFLGVSWQFPVELDESDRIAMAKYEDSVRQAIWTILGTSKGERVMRPDFGCGIHDLVFAVNSAGTAGRVASEVRRALRQWEPRIDVENVVAFPDTREPNKLLIEINYRVRTTNNRFNLVYPFYLE